MESPDTPGRFNPSPHLVSECLSSRHHQRIRPQPRSTWETRPNTSPLTRSQTLKRDGPKNGGPHNCFYTFSFSFPRGCGPGLSEGTGTLEYQGRYLVQNLIVTIHGTTFEAEGVYEFPNTGGILHTTLTGKHQCSLTDGTQGAFSGSSQYVA